MSNNIPNGETFDDRVFLEKKERIRIVFAQKVGLDKIIDLIKEKYQTEVFKNSDKIIIFVEEEIVEEKNDKLI